MDSDDAAAAQQELGLTADRSWRRGQRRSTVIRGQHKYSGFEFVSTLPDSADAGAHVVELVERLKPAAAGLRELGLRPSTHSIRLTVAEHTLSDNAMVGMDNDTIGLIAAMGAELVTDVYFEPEDDE